MAYEKATRKKAGHRELPSPAFTETAATRGSRCLLPGILKALFWADQPYGSSKLSPRSRTIRLARKSRDPLRIGIAGHDSFQVIRNAPSSVDSWTRRGRSSPTHRPAPAVLLDGGPVNRGL